MSREYLAGDIVVVYHYKNKRVPYDRHMVMAISDSECIDMTIVGIARTNLNSFDNRPTGILRCNDNELAEYVAVYSKNYIEQNNVTYPNFCKLVISAVSQCEIAEKNHKNLALPNIQEAMCSSLVVGLWQAALFEIFSTPEKVWDLMPLSYKYCLPDNVVDILGRHVSWTHVHFPPLV